MALPASSTQTFPGLTGPSSGLHSTGNDKCRTLSPGTIWELVVTRWRPFGMDQVAIAAAVMLAESGGRTCARNVNKDGSIDRGAWQINSSAHPDVSDACARDSVCSTEAALNIYKAAGNKWTPWSTFNNGAYKKHLDKVSIDSANVKEGGLAAGVNPLGHISDLLDTLFTGALWRRIGLITLGILALIGGVLFIGREYIPGPAGKLVKGLT